MFSNRDMTRRKGLFKNTSPSAGICCRYYCVANALSRMPSTPTSSFRFLGKPLMYTDHEAYITAEDRQHVSL